jgi:hypothetical protein
LPQHQAPANVRNFIRQALAALAIGCVDCSRPFRQCELETACDVNQTSD